MTVGMNHTRYGDDRRPRWEVGGDSIDAGMRLEFGEVRSEELRLKGSDKKGSNGNIWGEEEGIEEAKEGVNRMEIDGWEGTGYWVLPISMGKWASRQVLGTNWGKGWGQTLQLGRV